MMKRLPISISNFEEITKDQAYVYVDKTEFAYKLFSQKVGYKYIFLSRPRRFGKSLFLDTLKQMFLGKKEMFKGLWIYESDYDWQKFPIIHLDFSTVNKRSIEDLEAHLLNFVDSCANQYGVELKYFTSLEGRFSYLIQELAKINKVVILVDEYDKPILDNIKNFEKAEKIRDLLKSFYEVIKGNDANIRAVFLTGVTKFSQMSIFSGLNNIVDISLDGRYAKICGYTEEELYTYFKNQIENSSKALDLPIEILMNKVKLWYNGYRFTDKEIYVYNPFSIINFFDQNEFKNYWFATGTPSFLISLIETQCAEFKESQIYSYPFDGLGSFDLKSLEIIPVLYQAGYLTIVEYNSTTNSCNLDFPNIEMQNSFNKITPKNSFKIKVNCQNLAL